MRDAYRRAAAGVARAYSAGIFTEFMEQRADGHTVLDDKIYRKGMLRLSSRTSPKRIAGSTS